MAPLRLPLFLITGTPGSGKTATARALMRRFTFGLHIPVDELREWVVSGISQPVPEFTAETGRQFRLARGAAAQVAALYADVGFAVAVDDVIHESDAEALVALLAPRTVHKIFLQPTLDVALARNADRTNKGFDTAVLADAIRGNHRSLGEQNRADLGWIVIDNGALDVEQTVDAILESTLRDIINFRRLSDHLITGGQPTEAELALAAAAGAEVVINLGRLDPAYALPDERGSVAALGLIYEHIPVVWAEPTAADLDAFFAALARSCGTPAVRPLRGKLSCVGFQHALSRAPAGLADRGRAARPGRHLGSGGVSAMAGVYRGRARRRRRQGLNEVAWHRWQMC